MILIPSSVSTYQELASFSFFLSLISKNIDTTVKIIKLIKNSFDINLVNTIKKKVKHKSNSIFFNLSCITHSLAIFITLTLVLIKIENKINENNRLLILKIEQI